MPGAPRSTFDAADSDEEDDAGAVAAVAPPAMMDGIPPPLLPRASYEYIMEQVRPGGGGQPRQTSGVGGWLKADCPVLPSRLIWGCFPP